MIKEINAVKTFALAGVDYTINLTEATWAISKDGKIMSGRIRSNLLCIDTIQSITFIDESWTVIDRMADSVDAMHFRREVTLLAEYADLTTVCTSEGRVL